MSRYILTVYYNHTKFGFKLLYFFVCLFDESTNLIVAHLIHMECFQQLNVYL